MKYTDPDGNFSAVPTLLRVGAWAIRIGTVVEDFLTGGAGVADDAPSFVLAETMIATAELMILLEKAESNVKVKQSNEEQKSLSSFGSPLPDPDDDKDTKNEKNEKAPDPKKQYVDKDGNRYTYKPPKNWNGKADKDGNFPTRGNDKWGPKTTHNGTHAPHHDIQHSNGTHTPVYPEE